MKHSPHLKKTHVHGLTQLFPTVSHGDDSQVTRTHEYRSGHQVRGCTHSHCSNSWFPLWLFFLLVFRSSFTPQTNMAPWRPSLYLSTQMWPRFILEFHLSGYFRHIPTSTILSMWTWILSYQTQSHKVRAVQFIAYQEMCADTSTITHKTKCVTIL